VQTVAHRSAWQVPLFNLFNQCRDTGTRLVIASHTMPDDLQVTLPDLLSRLKSGVSLQMQSYKDADRRRLLQHRANRRGLYLSDEAALFMLNRLPRDSRQLMEALEILDGASMQEQRRLTTPFVKAVLKL
jgi:DnaA family protein